MTSSVADSTDLEDWLDVGSSSPTFHSLALDDVLQEVALIQDDDSLSFLDGSDAASLLGANPSPPLPSALSYKTDPGISFLRLDAISHQLASLSAKSGSPTSICESRGTMAIGASRGMIMLFNAQNRLDTFFPGEGDSGGVACLAFSPDGRYLAAGFSKGDVKVFNVSRRVIFRTIRDAVQPGRGMLQILYLDSSRDFLTLDSGGNVFEVRLKTSLTRRITHQVRCVFSGCNGEVVFMKSMPYNLLVLLTVTKILIVSTKSGGSVLCAFPVKHFEPSPPLFDFFLQAGKRHRFFRMCLCRGDKLTIFALYPDKFGTKERVAALVRSVHLPFDAVSLSWITANGIVLFNCDGSSVFVDVERGLVTRSSDADLPIVFSASDFKGLATGGNVSAALSCLADFICYQSVFRHGDSVLILTHEGIYSVRANTELEQLGKYDQRDDRVSPCLYLLDMVKGKVKSSLATPEKLDSLLQVALQRLTLFAIDGFNDGQIAELVAHFRKHVHILLHVCVEGRQTAVLFDYAWPRFERDALLRSVFLDSLDEWVLDGALESAPPSLISAYLSHLACEGHFSQLQAAICRFPIHSIDLHMVMTVCRQNGLYDGVIYVMNKALCDYITPLEEMLDMVAKFASNDVISDSEVEQGNRLLLYIHCCLAGQSYPFGELPEDFRMKVPLEVFRCITSLKGKDGSSSTDQYPYLRVLLQFDAQQFLNVIATCVDAPLFAVDEGRLQRLLEMIGVICESVGSVASLTNFLILVVRLVEAGRILVPTDTVEICIRRLFRHNILNSATEAAVVDVLRSVPQLDRELVLRLALSPLRLRICTFIYFCDRRFVDAITTVFSAEAPHKPEVFSLVRSILTVDLTPSEMADVSSFVKSIMPELCSIDSAQAAQLMIDSFPDFLPELCAKDESRRAEVFPVLKAAFELRRDRQQSHLSGEDTIDEQLFGIYYQGLVEQMRFNDAQLKELLLYWLPIGSRTDYCLNISTAHNKPISSILLLEARDLFDRAFNLVFEQLSNSSEVADLVFWVDELLALSSRHSLEAAEQGYLMKVFREVTKQSRITSDEMDKRLTVLISRILSSSSQYAYELFSCLLENESFQNGNLRDNKHIINEMLSASSFEKTMLTSIVHTMDDEIGALLKDMNLQTAKKVAGGFVTAGCVICGQSTSKSAYVYSCGHVVHLECDDGSRLCTCSSSSRKPPVTRDVAQLLRPIPRKREQKNIFMKWNEPLRLFP